MSERHIELVWRCTSCRSTNLGRFTVCQTCGNPKDDSEEYEMPSDSSTVESVTDPGLLRMATAGANWSCRYCASNQRDLDGACASCGAGRREGANANAPPASPAPAAPSNDAAPAPAPKGCSGCTIFIIAILLLAFGGCGVTCVSCANSCSKPDDGKTPTSTISTTQAVPKALPRTEFTGVVAGVRWERTITLQKYALAPHEAFTSEVPSNAVGIRAAAPHVHHQEDVFDHNETVYETVEVPDGYRTETYTESVACGQKCETTRRTCKEQCTGSPRRCREECTNKKNGFASCRDVCTGGDEKCREVCTGGDKQCETKYCDKTRTRQVAKTRTESRPTTVPRYRQVPRYAPWSTFQLWGWVDKRTEKTSGNDAKPTWPNIPGKRPIVLVSPSGTPLPGKGDAVKATPNAEQELRSEALRVTFRTDTGSVYEYEPASLEEFEALTVGSSHPVNVIGGQLSIRH